MNKSIKSNKFLIKKPITLTINKHILSVHKYYWFFFLSQNFHIHNNSNSNSTNNSNSINKFCTYKRKQQKNKIYINITKIYNKTVYLEKNIQNIDDFIKNKYNINSLNTINIYNQNNINIYIIIIDYKSKLKLNTNTYFDLLFLTNEDDIVNKKIYNNILKFNNKNKTPNIYLYNSITIKNDVFDASIKLKSIYRHIVGYI